MPSEKISAMTPAGPLDGTEVVPVVRPAQNLRTTTGAIAGLAPHPGGPDLAVQFQHPVGVFGGNANFNFQVVGGVEFLTVGTTDYSVSPIYFGATINYKVHLEGESTTDPSGFGASGILAAISQANPSADNLDFTGILAPLLTPVGNNRPINSLTAVDGFIYTQGDGPINELFGMRFSVFTEGAGNTGIASAMTAALEADGAGTFVEGRVVWILPPFLANPATTWTGFYISDQTQAGGDNANMRSLGLTSRNIFIGQVISGQAVEPADASLENSQFVWWQDLANNRVCVKTKDAGGIIHRACLPLGTGSTPLMPATKTNKNLVGSSTAFPSVILDLSTGTTTDYLDGVTTVYFDPAGGPNGYTLTITGYDGNGNSQNLFSQAFTIGSVTIDLGGRVLVTSAGFVQAPGAGGPFFGPYNRVTFTVQDLVAGMHGGYKLRGVVLR